ncbi:hypothetical protein [Aureimonas sp. AU40]|uniref:hypothetical protein n=1 Tax=Aureimonas sp. AU40 TaxID=1637747 RepID=UPI000AB973F6|nr:hypothetical protein [Aureimonas sp. AU40]
MTLQDDIDAEILASLARLRSEGRPRVNSNEILEQHVHLDDVEDGFQALERLAAAGRIVIEGSINVTVGAAVSLPADV